MYKYIFSLKIFCLDVFVIFYVEINTNSDLAAKAWTDNAGRVVVKIILCAGIFIM